MLLLLAYGLEHRLLFGHARILRQAPPGPFDGHLTEAITLHRQGERLEGVLARPLADALGADHSTAHTLLVWFGGRNEDVRWTPAIAGWLGSGHAVASFRYRSKPLQPDVVSDALMQLAWLRQEPRFEHARLVLAGRSLGSAVALQVAAALPNDTRLAGLILVSPMDSVRAMVAAHPLFAPLAGWIRSPFDSLAVAHRISCPVLVVLAQHDRRVPHRRSMRLVERLRQGSGPHDEHGVEVVLVPGTDHRSVARSPGTLSTLSRFVDDLP